MNKLKELLAAGEIMRDTDKAAADAWNQPTDYEHDRLTLEADRLFEEFGHKAEAALPELQLLLSRYEKLVAWASANGKHSKNCGRKPALPVGTFIGCTCGLDELKRDIEGE